MGIDTPRHRYYEHRYLDTGSIDTGFLAVTNPAGANLPAAMTATGKNKGRTQETELRGHETLLLNYFFNTASQDGSTLPFQWLKAHAKANPRSMQGS